MFKIRKNLDEVDDSRLIVLYTTLTKIFLIVSILFILWIVFVALGAFVLELGSNWAVLNLENWILSWCFLVGIFIILDVAFYLHYTFVIGKRSEFGGPEPKFMHGKRLYIYTSPADSEGGIFSKTYIQIDENSVLRLRDLMVSPGELWNKKEE